MNNIDLQEFAGGALAERFNLALKEVLENLRDPNTPYNKKRKLMISLDFETNEAREISSVDIIAKTKLCAARAVTTSLIMDIDCKGEVIASEYKKQIPGQTTMTVNKESGEIGTNVDYGDLEGLQIVK